MIEAEALAFTYPGRSGPALRGLTFTIDDGEIFGFLGPSGSGKSTTQKILTGLLDGYLGRVRVFGREVAGWGSAYYEQIGVGFELPNHYQKLSALENLEFFRSLYSGPTADPLTLLARVGLADDARTRVSQFSKGMQMRLSLARALLNRPKLLFLDEPTSGLDPVNARRVREVIREQQRVGATIFLTTHAMAVADELCDRGAFLVDGAIAALDTPRSLKLQLGQRRVRVEYQENHQTVGREFPLDGIGEDGDFLRILQ